MRDYKTCMHSDKKNLEKTVTFNATIKQPNLQSIPLTFWNCHEFVALY